LLAILIHDGMMAAERNVTRRLGLKPAATA
jgi:hypothetical protein